MEQPWEVSQAWLGAGGQLGTSVQDGAKQVGWGRRERETEVGVSEEEWGGRCPRASGAMWWLGGWGRGLFEEGQLCGAYSGSLGPWVGPGSGWAGGRTIVDCSYSQDTNAFT